MKTKSYAALSAETPLVPFLLERREMGPADVVIDILFSGVCHSDIHQARGEWRNSTFPMVPGHEIIGRVSRVGAKVTRLKVGALVGVGCMTDACRSCGPCGQGHEQFCEQGTSWTYNSTEMDRVTRTYGGYASQIVVTEHFVLTIPESLDPAGAAPLLCAGITTYSPLKEWNCKKGDRIAVVGLGGLGHMAVKLAKAMGAEVTLLSTSAGKQADSSRLGATAFALTTSPSTFTRLDGKFDLIIDTVSAQHDYNAYLRLLRPFGAMVIVGVPSKPTEVAASSLINRNLRLAGSSIGGIAQTQEMLEFCGKHKIVADVEVIPIQQINQAYERVLRNDVRYRFVIDGQSLGGSAT